MAGSFFEFEAALPASMDDGMQDENEDEYDALNDETFGTTIDDDWEQNHEKLAEFTEQSRGHVEKLKDLNHNPETENEQDIRNGEDLEASLSQLVLDFDELDVNNSFSRIQTQSSQSLHFPDSPSVFQNSISSVWAVGKHDLTVPTSTSSPLAQRTPLPSSVKNVCTLEELERNLLQSSSIPPPGLSSTLRLEDVERKITQGMPQQRFNLPNDMTSRIPPGLGQGTNLLTTLQNHRVLGAPNLINMGMNPGINLGLNPGMNSGMNSGIHSGMNPLNPGMSPGRVDAPKVPLQQLPIGFNNSNISHQLPFHQQHGFQPIHPGPGILQLGPQQQQMSFNINGPRVGQFHPNNQHHQQHMQHLQHHQRQGGINSSFQHHQQNQHHQHNAYYNNHHHQSHRVGAINGAGDYDEYAGLMTPWQKQWLLNIQTLQLNVGAPYIVDYYYTVFKNRKESNNSAPQFFKSLERSSGRERSDSVKPGRERPPSVMGPAKAYTPLQFENSLGKLQCVSVTAPRKLIDMDIMSADGSDGSQSTQRDQKKTKQLLLEIERLYVLLLDLEDAFSPLAKQAAAEAAVARAMRDPPDTESEPEKPCPEDLILRMMSSLLQGDKIQGFMGIRKGKTFLLRLLPHLPPDSAVHTSFWGQVMVGLAALLRRDQGDALLPRFLPELYRWLDVCGLPQLLKLTTVLVAEASTKHKLNRSSLASAVSSPFGVSVLAAIVSSAQQHLASMTEEQSQRWVEFIGAVVGACEATRITEENSIHPAKPVEASTLQCHLDICGPAISTAQAAILKRLLSKTDSVESGGSCGATKTELAVIAEKKVWRPPETYPFFIN